MGRSISPSSATPMSAFYSATATGRSPRFRDSSPGGTRAESSRGLRLDGLADLAVLDGSSDTVSIYLGRGDGTFGPEALFQTGAEPFAAIARDLDGDRRLDLAFPNAASNEISILFNTGPFPNQPPVADAGPEQTVECTGNLQAVVRLDGSASTDPDSTPGTNDDIVSYLWSEGESSLATGEQASVPLSLGAHGISLRVTDKGGLADTDDLLITVQDTLPPTGRLTSPLANACFGPAALPVIVTDDFTDQCDPSLRRIYDPAPGPGYSSHGDHHVVLTVEDGSHNTASSSVDFMIDTQAPRVQILRPPDIGLGLPASLPFSIIFRADDDDDGATGGVVHEVVKVQGCVIYDGLTYGDGTACCQMSPCTWIKRRSAGLPSCAAFRLSRGPLCKSKLLTVGNNIGIARRTFREA